MFSNLSQERFNILKKRAQEFIDDGGHDTDPLILEANKAINANPYLATIWSCQGHSTGQIMERDGDDANYDHDYMEFTFAVENSEKGLEQLAKISKELSNFSYQTWTSTRPSLTLIELLWAFGDNDLTPMNLERMDRYTCWRLKLRYFVDITDDVIKVYNRLVTDLFTKVNKDHAL